MESHLEARLWNDAFNLSQDMLALPRGTVRATVLIETILAAFEMDEILFELREHRCVCGWVGGVCGGCDGRGVVCGCVGVWGERARREREKERARACVC